MRIYYIYQYVRLDTETICYVGKGKNKRAYNIKRHNNHCQQINKLHGIRIEMLQENLEETEAFKQERILIAKYKKQGMCEANHALGGQGKTGPRLSMRGRVLTASHKTNVSIATKKAMACPQLRARLSAAKKGQLPHNIKAVIDLASGLIWSSITEAAKIYSYNNQTLRAWLSGQMPNPTSLRKIG